MRSTPIIGNKAWFGPKRRGWGLGPASVEGWLVLVGLILVSSVARRTGQPSWTRHLFGVIFLAIAILKGTAPGGPRAYAAFKQAAGQPTR